VTDIDTARREFGARLRELRRATTMTGPQLATAAGWHHSKVYRLERGDRMPSEADLATWCRVCDAAWALTDLTASLRNVETQWAQWRRLAATGHARRQRRSIDLEARTSNLRIYQPTIVPGLLQTRPYAAAVLAQCIEFLGTPDDLDDAVDARMQRQQVLHQGRRQIAILVHETALYTGVGDDAVRVEQLQHLLGTAFGNPRLIFAVVPRSAGFVYLTGGFHLFDHHLALIETASAELSIVAPSELALYERLWDALYTQAVTGDTARALISAAR
jgi:transcriptional regulator with XRE-family HTH domain